MALKPSDIVVYESTVYHGATKEECAPILEQSSGLVCGSNFAIAYSPECINPGDHQHRFEMIQKVVAGQHACTLDIVAAVYGPVITASVHRAPIKVAEERQHCPASSGLSVSSYGGWS
jgi:UDP-N-acetyl-D-glucosamine/UDP-N-acetyl-D-galactosamine dehydrogenase